MSRRLTRHIKTRHKDVQRVKGALLMKKECRIIRRFDEKGSAYIMKEKPQRNILCSKVNGNRESTKSLLNAVRVWSFYQECFLVYTNRVAG